MFCDRFLVFVCFLTIKHQLCHGQCENYYLLLERYMDMDLGGEQYRTFSIKNKKWSVLDVNTNETVESFDINCVLDLNCNIQTEIITVYRPIIPFGSDFRFGSKPSEYISAIPLIPTTPYPVYPTTPHIPTTDTNSTRPDNPMTDTNFTKPYIPLTVTEPTTTEEEFIFDPGNMREDPTINPTNEMHTTTENLDESGVIITPNVPIEPESTTQELTTTVGGSNNSAIETTATENLRPESTTQGLKNTTGDGSKTSGALYAGNDPKDSQVLAGKIVGGVLGVVSAGIIMFVGKMLIQQYLQSGVYRIPDP